MAMPSPENVFTLDTLRRALNMKDDYRFEPTTKAEWLAFEAKINLSRRLFDKFGMDLLGAETKAEKVLYHHFMSKQPLVTARSLLRLWPCPL